MLSKRLITGPLLVVALLGLAFLNEYVGTLEWKTSVSFFWPMSSLGIEAVPPGAILFAICSLVIVLAARELAAVAVACSGGTSSHKLEGLIYCFGILSLYAMWLGGLCNDPMMAVGMLATVLAACFFGSLWLASLGQRTEGTVIMALMATGFTVYLGVFLGFFMLIQVEHSVWWIIGVIAIVKMCDTGAYFTGCSIGRHKLIPWLSPGKTWEGLAGGLLAAIGTAWGLSALSAAWLPAEPVIPTWLALLLGLVIGFCGQCGDLVMSMMKRDAGLRDSSSLLPGLGGIMDVLDSPLFVAPIAWWMLQLV